MNFENNLSVFIKKYFVTSIHLNHLPEMVLVNKLYVLLQCIIITVILNTKDV